MINIIGLGYIGLPTSLMFAASGHEVVGTDLDEQRVAKLSRGELPFEEKGMEELMQAALNKGIRFSTDYQETDVYIITVPSPYNPDTKKVDPSYIIAAVSTALEKAHNQGIIVVESTVSPGTMDKYVRPLVNAHMEETGETIHLVHAPERILPGNMVHELRHNARTVGCDDPVIGEKIKAIYESFCENEITITDIKSAEMSKVVENTYRDINIAFANELLKICEVDDLDVYEIIRIANKHPRVNILNPGPGVGGHCIPVDPWFLVGDYPEQTQLIRKARDINDSMPEKVLHRIHEIMKLEGMTDVDKVGLYGLTYKANVDDVRESPTLQLLEKQKEHLAPELRVYDPMVQSTVTNNQESDFDSFIEKTDLVVIMMGHQHILDHLDALEGKIILDTQNILPKDLGAYKLI